ncbi:hypothetical protein D9757_001463 [Collybiopsis confluens]|uniref:F-box domain-containing protein n=1 Tax=Collybiopsis confluens TaxID=2823264 RepID=A0A8H5HZD2_9AGAR|nr:hypothetical protein D9757_001463 [Collybiopsis confluens]
MGQTQIDSLAALDSDLNALRDMKADLLRDLDEINAKIHEAEIKRAPIHNDLVPISKLPSEIFSDILLTCQNDQYRTHLYASQVCTRWRCLVQNTPRLWAEIRIHLLPKKSTASLQKFETYLNRSGPTCPYTLSLFVDNKKLDFSPFLGLLTAHISRCNVLEVWVLEHAKASLQLREHFESLHAPQLERLDLNVDYVQDASYVKGWSTTPSIFKAGVPSLRSLRLSGYAGALLPPVSSDITTLHLDGRCIENPSALTFRQMLSAMPSLVNLSLQGLKVDRVSDTVLELPRLRSLRYRPANRLASPDIHCLGALPLKQLDTLVLCEASDLRLFEFPNVKSLVLWDCEFGVAQVGHVMLAFPALENLSLHSSSLIYMALGIDGKPIWWPKLKTLCIRDLVPSEVSMLLRMVKHRKSVNYPLELVTMDQGSRRRAQREKVHVELASLVDLRWASDVPEPWPDEATAAGHDGFWYGDLI